MKNELGLAPPRPWHVVLSPALPILALLAGNFAGLVPGAAIWSIAIVVPTALLCWLALARIVGNYRTSALAVSILSLTALSQSTIAQVARLFHAGRLLPLITLGALVLCGLILKRGGALAGWTTFTNALMVSSTILVVWPVAATQLHEYRSPTVVLQPLDVPENASLERPDIYILILDGYGRSDVLRDHYGFENPLTAELEAQGFAVAHRAVSNYAQTAQSLASALNLEYLPTLLEPQGPGIEPRQRFADLITHNRTFATLAAAGYRIRAYPSEYGLIKTAAQDRPRPLMYWTDFEYGLYENSVLPLLFTTFRMPPGVIPAAVHRRHILWTLGHLERELPHAADPPTLVFAHLLIPHPPFTFEADGTPLRSRVPANLNDGTHWRAQAAHTTESYETGYVKAIRFLNARLLAIIRRVCDRSRRPAVVYLQGDHGPGSRLDWNDPAATDVRERMGILLTVRFPDGSHTPIHDGTTPVNAFRTLLNAVLGTSLPMLEDRAYFSPWLQPLRFIDVTDRLAAAHQLSPGVSAPSGAK